VLGDGWHDYVTVHRLGEAPEGERIPAPGELPLLAELRAFLGHLDGGPGPRTAAADGAQIVAALAKLRELAGFS
jgi:hypothetical protein